MSDTGESRRPPTLLVLRRGLTQPLFRGLVWSLRSVATAIGLTRAMSVARPAGRVFYWVCPWWRRVAEDNLTRAFPEWDRAQVRSCAVSVFVNLTKTLFEFLTSKGIDEDGFRARTRIHGFDQVREAASRGNGIIYLAAHYDNWEWVGRRLALEGVPLTVIARRNDDPRFEQLISDTRAAHGMSVSDRDDVRSALRALRRGEAVGILPDQNSFGPGGFVQFFGRPASTAYGPFRLWQRTGAAVFHSLSRRAEDDTHDLYLWPMEIPRQTGDPEIDANAFMQRAASDLEEWIRQEPSQWLWIHKRWKRQPDDGSGQ